MTRKYCVLCVEDNPANMKLVEQLMLQLPAVTLMAAETAEEGIVLARKHHPDLILMDINLPGMDGHEALKELRKDKQTSDIPVVALTANAMASDVQRGVENGFIDYLTKPINVQAFLDMIQHQLNMDS